MANEPNPFDEQIRNYEASIRGEFDAYQLARVCDSLESMWNQYPIVREIVFRDFQYTRTQQSLYAENFQRGIEIITLDMQAQNIENPIDMKWPAPSRIRFHNLGGAGTAIEDARENNFDRAYIEGEIVWFERNINEYETTGLPEHYKPSSSVRMNIDGALIGLRDILKILED